MYTYDIISQCCTNGVYSILDCITKSMVDHWSIKRLWSDIDIVLWPGNTYTHTTHSCLPYRCTVYTSGESTLVLSISNVAWVYSLGGNIRRPAVANGAWRFGLDTHDWTPATTTAAVSRFSIVSAFVPVTLYTLWLDLQLYVC